MLSPATKNSYRAQAQHCSQLIQNARFITAFTGAGISTRAGIPDFRGPQGLYLTQKYDPDVIFNIRYFLNDPEPFYNFARDFLKTEENIRPTFAHHFLAQLEGQNRLKGIITQNIDGLHQRAGSKTVLEMHGSFLISHCLRCGREFSFTQLKQKILGEQIPRCACSGLIKPDVVFYGEDVRVYEESCQLAIQSDLMFIIGTSCVVYPAASIPTFAKGKIIIVNQQRIEFEFENIILNVQADIDQFFTQVHDEMTNF